MTKSLRADPKRSAATPVPAKHHLDKTAHELAANIAAGADADELLTTGEAAALLKRSTQFLEIGRCHGYGPRFIRQSPRCIRYKRSELIAWLDSRTHQCTSEYLSRKAGK